MPKHFEQSQPQALQFLSREAPGHSPRPDPGAKQRLVGINVANPGQQRLIEKSHLDRQPAPAKKPGKMFFADHERLGALARESGTVPQIAKIQPSEPPRIDEAQFPAAAQRETRMSMRGHRSI